MQAPTQIRSWTSIGVERIEVLLPVSSLVSDFGSDYLQCCLAGRLKFCFARSPDERGRVATTCEPTLLLPPREARRSRDQFADYADRHRLPSPVSADALRIDKLRITLLMCVSIGDAPGTYPFV
jgi:hypothetical protein